MLKQIAPLAKRIEFNDANTVTIVASVKNCAELIQILNDNNIDYADTKSMTQCYIDVEIEEIA